MLIRDYFTSGIISDRGSLSTSKVRGSIFVSPKYFLSRNNKEEFRKVPKGWLPNSEIS